MGRAPAETNILIVGGGPAGLGAAIAARKAGFDVTVLDRSRPPIDKACGEGLMPDGVVALREIGVDLNMGDGAPFRGIRFIDGGIEAEALFPEGSIGIGIRRTRLHEALVSEAERAGVALRWQTAASVDDAGIVTAEGRQLRYNWLIGADGIHSWVRQSAGLQIISSTRRRIGIRQHFRVEPWTDFVEVHWNRHCQANVTPVGPDEVCIAMIGTGREVRASDIQDLFPKLARRLCGAQEIGTPRGAVTLSSTLNSVVQGRTALLGDASGTVDAVTGEGMHLAFRQAKVLIEALVQDDLGLYSAAHRKLARMPLFMAEVLLILDGRDTVRRTAFQSLAAFPSLFRALLAFHIGGHESPLFWARGGSLPGARWAAEPS